MEYDYRLLGSDTVQLADRHWCCWLKRCLRQPERHEGAEREFSYSEGGSNNSVRNDDTHLPDCLASPTEGEQLEAINTGLL